MALDMNKAPKPKGGKDFGIANAGVQMARLVAICEIGEQERSFKGEAKAPAIQLNFTFELPNDLIEVKTDDGVESKPRWVSINNVNFFTDDKARLVEIVRALDPNNECQGILTELVGRPCFVTIEHKVRKDNAQTYAKVSAVSGVPAGIAIPDLANEPRVFDWEAPSREQWDLLPAWVQEKIKTALNYSGSTVEAMLNGEATGATASDPDVGAGGGEAGTGPAPGDFDDDIPF